MQNGCIYTTPLANAGPKIGRIYALHKSSIKCAGPSAMGYHITSSENLLPEFVLTGILSAGAASASRG